jgi:hypothetical protein
MADFSTENVEDTGQWGAISEGLKGKNGQIRILHPETYTLGMKAK